MLELAWESQILQGFLLEVALGRRDSQKARDAYNAAWYHVRREERTGLFPWAAIDRDHDPPPVDAIPNDEEKETMMPVSVWLVESGGKIPVFTKKLSLIFTNLVAKGQKTSEHHTTAFCLVNIRETLEDQS